ncbi:MAG TPA: Lrp/AsnC family transcriptional regulator [Trebonia sp.]|nr:Lrp/AsnC family transcriptional regulator [Trebonia sp.]
MESSILDDADERIVHGLVVEPRVPFRVLADVVGLSPQTVARRYRRLQDVASLRVTGRVAAPRVGWVNWYVRLQCVPGAAVAVAAALAKRPDTGWVFLASGGAEIICSLQARSSEQRDELLLDGLPSSRSVVRLIAHSLLSDYSPVAWPRLTRALTDDECRRLGLVLPPVQAGPVQAGPVQAGAVQAGPVGAGTGPEAAFFRPLDARDERLLDLLARDGRASNVSLVSSTGWHESTVRRRIAELRRSGILEFDVYIDPAVFGAAAYALLWASVDPARIDDIGAAMAGHDEVPFVSATTGPTNLMATLVCRDTTELHAYLTRRLAVLPGVRAVETTPLIRAVKRAGPGAVSP